MKKLTSSLVMLALLLCLTAPAVRADEIISARFSTSPEFVFVNQPFELQFEMEVPAGASVQDLHVSAFPQERLKLTLGQLEELPRQQLTRDGRRIDRLRFSASATAAAVGEQTVRSMLQGMFTERNSSGFFSFLQSHLVQKAVEPFTLKIQSLPVAGRPADFSGAIGVFKLTGVLSSPTAQPGDILTLTLDLSGEGNLNAAAPALAAVDGFKTYPPKTLEASATHVRLQQIYIPQSASATTIPAVTFAFFNPRTHRYETVSAGPFRIRFTKPTETVTNAVRVINTADTAEKAQQTLLQLPRQVIWSASKVVTRETARRTDVRFAPSRAALSLFILPPRQKIQLLETQGGWARIDLDGNRGWIPVSDLEP